MSLRIRWRDAALSFIGDLERYVSVEAVKRHNDAGAWTIDLPLGSYQPDAAGIVIDLDGRQLLSGPITSIARQRETSDGDRRDIISLGGTDDTAWVETRIISPQPGAYPPYTVAVDDRTGPCETLIHGFVDANLGPGARADRRLPALRMGADLGRGRVVRVRRRFAPLGELARQLGSIGGLGWRIIQVDRELELETFVLADRSANARFGDGFANLGDFAFHQERGPANAVTVGGGGVGTARVVIEQSAPAAIRRWGRVESFVDQRHTSSPDELVDSATTTLAEGADRVALVAEVIDTETTRFGRDYDLGDRVRAIIDDVHMVQTVQQVTLRVEAGKALRIEPMIGAPGTLDPRAPRLIANLRRLGTRLNSLEAQ